MPGLVPGIHVFRAATMTWVAGTSLAMTNMRNIRGNGAMRLIAALVVFVLGTSTGISYAADPGNSSENSRGVAWSEVKWPFLTDQWGQGRAFVCAAATCGADVKLYLRAKVGFCNCQTGVSDDAELDRVGDLEIFSERWTGLDAGRPIKIGWMNGRSRAYRVEVPYAGPVTALAVAFNDKCDVAVVTVVAAREHLVLAERLALDFLNSDLVLHWAERELGF
jgi:hypothetical protein